MKSSARNQWDGTVSEIEVGAVYAEIAIQLNGGTILISTVTMASVQALGLIVGSPVLALVKSTQVTLISDLEGYRLSTRNQLSGIIQQIAKGPVSSEVTLSLPTGEMVVAAVTTESANALGLQIDQTVTAVFKAGAVMLAAPIGAKL
jgi:molybdate transport system regulatory protein